MELLGGGPLASLELYHITWHPHANTKICDGQRAAIHRTQWPVLWRETVVCAAMVHSTVNPMQTALGIPTGRAHHKH